MTRFRTVYSSDLVSIHAWDCDGEGESRRRAPENGFVFIQDGAFRVRSNVDSAVVTSGTVLFARRSDRMRITHPAGGGDRGVVVRIADRVLSEVDRAPPTGSSAVLVPPSTMLRLRGLLALVTGDEAARLDADERAFEIVSTALDALSDPRESPATAEQTRKAHRDAVERVKVLVTERYAESLALEEIAREACYSVFHLCRVFKSCTGVSVHRYVNRVRLVAALEMLESRAPVTETALRVGFSTPSHFSDAFRRELGLRPTDAREAMNDPAGAAQLLRCETAAVR